LVKCQQAIKKGCPTWEQPFCLYLAAFNESSHRQISTYASLLSQKTQTPALLFQRYSLPDTFRIDPLFLLHKESCVDKLHVIGAVISAKITERQAKGFLKVLIKVIPPGIRYIFIFPAINIADHAAGINGMPFIPIRIIGIPISDKTKLAC